MCIGIRDYFMIYLLTCFPLGDERFNILDLGFVSDSICQVT